MTHSTAKMTEHYTHIAMETLQQYTNCLDTNQQLNTEVENKQNISNPFGLILNPVSDEEIKMEFEKRHKSKNR